MFFHHLLQVIIRIMVPKIINNFSKNMQTDVNFIFSLTYTGSIMGPLIINISQGRSLMVLKISPISA